MFGISARGPLTFVAVALVLAAVALAACFATAWRAARDVSSRLSELMNALLELRVEDGKR